MRAQSCKSKGRRLQQRVARSVLARFPHLTEDDVASTSMGANGEDVRLSPRARTVLPLSIECKCTERLNVWSALEQAQSNTPAGTTPCVVFSRNRSPTYAVLPWDCVLGLYARAQEGGAGVPTRLRDLLEQLCDATRALPPPAADAPPGASGGLSGEEDEEEGGGEEEDGPAPCE
jgi:hypothetical protein